MIEKLELPSVAATVTAILLGLTGPARAQEMPRILAVKNVSIVDVEGGRLIDGRTVLIEATRIAAIKDAASAEIPDDARVIEGKGLYLMPGLFDAHVHYINPDSYGPLMIAHGVTFVRDLGGPTESILALRDELNRGARLGPAMMVTGAIIDGDPPIWPFSEVTGTAESARQAVRKLAGAGVDQIKLYSKLTPEAYFAAVDEARKLGLKTVGHVPLSVTMNDVLEAGQADIEHLEGFDALIAEAAGQPPTQPRSFADNFTRWNLYPQADKAILNETYGRMKRSGIAICPTMVVLKGIGSVGSDAPHDPWLAAVPEYLRSMWNSPLYEQMAAGARRTVPLMQAVVADLHESGVTLMCGTDLANPYVIAGRSLHVEMELFQEAGVPAADVLRSATLTPAKFMGVDDRLGTVQAGKTASLVLCRKNPLDDIRNAAEIEGVFLRGRYFDRTELDGIVDQIMTSAEPVPAEQAAEGELALPGTELHRGRYKIKFEQWDAGTEEFLVTETDEGYSIKADQKPKGGPQRPSFGTLHMDKAFRFQSATWVQPGNPALRASYVIEGNVLVATATKGDADPEVQRLELPDDWVVSAPFLAFDLSGLAGSGLEAGASRTLKAVGFGFPDWRMGLADFTIERHEDRPMPRGESEVTAHYYTTLLKTPAGNFVGEVWTDGFGVILKSVEKMPFGTLTNTLD